MTHSAAVAWLIIALLNRYSVFVFCDSLVMIWRRAIKVVRRPVFDRALRGVLSHFGLTL